MGICIINPKFTIWSRNIFDFYVFLTGIHVIARAGVKLSYMIYNLSTGKVEHDSQFPTDAQAFMGSHRSDISLHNTGDVSITTTMGP